MILLRMRKDWDEGKCAHVPPDRREQLASNWARLRLIDKYEAEFAMLKRTGCFVSPGMREKAAVAGMPACADLIQLDPTDPKSVRPSLSNLDLEDIRRLVAKLPEPRRRVVELLLFEGHTQQEAAEILGNTQPAVSAAFERARNDLTELLADYR